MIIKLQTCLRIKWPGEVYSGLLAFIFVCLINPPIYAQDFQISGVVKSSPDGESLLGVNVVIKGTTTGTVTDIDGAYKLSVNSQNDILVFSSVGYIPEEIEVGNRSVINVSLVPDITALEEIVVIGYGEVKRSDLTGSVSSISGDEIKKTNPVTFDQALIGKVPGLYVQQISGQPGGAVSVQIRGLSSFGSSGPLYVIDGVIIGSTASMGEGTNPLAAINPSEIESVDVLKDASATAIYGSQATNGVIVITTKRGDVAPPRITYEFYTGFQQLPNKLPVMDLQEYATFINERNEGLGWGFDTRDEFQNPQYLGEGTDWQDELFRNASMSNHNLTISGGDSRTQYLLSGSYFKQEGIALGSEFKRISIRLNLDNQTTDWLKIGTSMQFANINENVNASSSNVINTALSQTPDIPVQNADGSWGGAYNPDGWVNNTVNPYAIALINKDEVNRNQVFGNIYANIKFMDGLTLNNELTGSFSMATEDKFNPTYTMGLVVNNINSGSYSYAQNAYSTFRNYLTYAHIFGTRYNLNVMVGHEAQLSTSENVSASRTNFPSNNVQVISSGDQTTAKNSGTKGQSSQESYFGRINFGFDDRFLLTGNVRADGSSKFAEDNRWVVTYSGALAWKINNENFMKSVGMVDELKLRVGYGLTNNQNIRDYAYTSTLATVPTGLSGISQLTRNIGNPFVEWEKTEYANIGMDGSFFKRRLSFTLDFYNRETDGLVLQVPLPLYSGTAIGWSPGSLDAPWVNVGTINNKGFDLSVRTVNIQKDQFTWTTEFVASRNINKVLKLNTDGASLDGQYSKTVVGGSIGQFYGYVVEGVFANAEDFETHALPVRNEEELAVGAAGGSIWYGDLMFKDFNNDGIIDERDQTFLGSPIPKFQYGLNNSFTYKNFDFNIFFTANYGNKVFNQLRINGEYPGTSFGYLKALKDYAKLELIDPLGSETDINNVYVSNPETRIVGIRNDNTNDNNRTSDKYVEDGSFLRCRTISLGYTFGGEQLQRAHIQNLRAYVNVSNAFIITNYKGMDPEIGSWDPLNAGVDSGFYPQSRVFTFGLNISLGN